MVDDLRRRTIAPPRQLAEASVVPRDAAPAAKVPTHIASGVAGDGEPPGGEAAALLGASGLLAGLGALLASRRRRRIVV